MWTDIGIEDAASANTDGLCIIDCVKVGEIVLKVFHTKHPPLNANIHSSINELS